MKSKPIYEKYGRTKKSWETFKADAREQPGRTQRRRVTPVQIIAMKEFSEVRLAIPRFTRVRNREIDRHVYALYQPSPRLRLAGGLTPDEIKIAKEAGK